MALYLINYNGVFMNKYFVIGDVHGKATMLNELLKNWDEKSQLIFLGDLIDRGENSYSVLNMVSSLVKNKNAVCLMGNHEYMFLSWIDDPEENYEHYQSNGGDSTINSILGRPLEFPVDNLRDHNEIITNHSNLISFIRQMPYHLETKDTIFVHAGLDLTLPNWKETSNYQKVWIRKPFHEGLNQTGKTIIFGHTPVYRLLNNSIGTKEIYQSKDNKIGMDGGAVYGGVLHGILFENGKISKDYIIHNDGIIAIDD